MFVMERKHDNEEPDSTLRVWKVHDAKVNLAALLNDPRKARRDYDLFTKTWGESFKDISPGSLQRSKWVPNVVRGHFESYLDTTSDRVLRHDSQSLKSIKTSSNVDHAGNISATYNGSRKKSAIKSAITAQHEREAILKTRAALDALPRIFLRSDFAMESPQIFGAVLNSTETPEPKNETSNNDKSYLKREVSSSKLLQEKLSHYLDMVEMAIVRQISLRSDAFFKAMSSHDQLHEYLTSTQNCVKNLLTKVKEVDRNIVQNSLQVVNLHHTLRNSEVLLERLHMVVTVHQTQPTIQLLLSTSEYAGSLDLIRTTQEVLHQELAGLHCFRHLSSQLTEMERVIGHMMQQEIAECLTFEIQRPIDEGHLCSEPHRISAVTLGLLRQGRFDFLEGFRGEIEQAVKYLIKEAVTDSVKSLPSRCDDPTGLLDDREEKQETLASRMRMLIFADWIILLDKIFLQLLTLLRRVKTILGIIGNVASEALSHGDIICVQHHKLKRKTDKSTNLHKEASSNKTNPFDDSTSESEQTNPFLNSADEESSNPFLVESPVKVSSRLKRGRLESRNAESSNPFVDDVDDMYGLASYEDELLTSAADSYLAPPTPLPEGNLQNGFQSDDNPSGCQGDLDKETESDVTSSYLGEVMTQEEQDNFTRMLRDMLCWTCDFQQDRCVKVLIAKGKDSSLDKLSSSDFLLLAKSVKHFTTESESIVQRDSGGKTNDCLTDERHLSLNGALKGALKTQASRFVSRFHEERRNKLSLILDNEVWKQAEVPTELSQLVQNLVDGKINQPERQESEEQENRSSEFLQLDGEQYIVVGTVLILLKMVSEYCKCSDDLPSSTSDLVHRLRDLLTLFNSRTCQLVLGAGALQLVGLKTITTKNLALASRCLQLILHCLPSIRSHFEVKIMKQSNLQSSSATGNGNLPPKHKSVLRHFDHVTKDYQDHVTEIEKKFVSIVSGVFDRQLAKWEVKAPVPSSSFRGICKQLTKFHDTVSALLPQDQIRNIVLTLNDELKFRVRKVLQRLNVRCDGGPQHGLVTSDLNFYETNVKNLVGIGKIDLKLSSVWS
uniref:Vacuolar protein sorting-associated protein 54 n=1 Tax=Phallusia mammillata TaxID=59560 RepID=A0A6F9DWY4_9ASCI|nr:vacuolar protein sorting-associated protein 54 [Phallusia mammillata]